MRSSILTIVLAAVACFALSCEPKKVDDPAAGGTPAAATPAAATPAAATPAAATPAAVTPAAVTPAAVTPAAAMEVEIGCAMCTYKMEGATACSPAVKTAEGTFLLVGMETKDEHQFCKEAKKATVEGKVEDGKFVATKVDLK